MAISISEFARELVRLEGFEPQLESSRYQSDWDLEQELERQEEIERGIIKNMTATQFADPRLRRAAGLSF